MIPIAERRINVAHIFVIGDIVGQPRLAHEAVHEAHFAAEVASGDTQAALEACVIRSARYSKRGLHVNRSPLVQIGSHAQPRLPRRAEPYQAKPPGFGACFTAMTLGRGMGDRIVEKYSEVAVQ